MKRSRVLVVVLAAALSACAAWRWSGSPPAVGSAPAIGHPTDAAQAGLSGGDELHPRPEPVLSKPELILSTESARARPRAVVPPTPPEILKNAAYPGDLGPAAIDVSSYPPRARADYIVYARVCSRCHTLARANYSARVRRAWWRLYITRMRARAAWKGARMTRAEARAILDFLDYDARARKQGRKAEFEQTTDELKRRFNAEMDARMGRLQKGRSVLDGR